eukprot:15365256-Ditylum_brightwellii.AAC.1
MLRYKKDLIFQSKESDIYSGASKYESKFQKETRMIFSITLDLTKGAEVVDVSTTTNKRYDKYNRDVSNVVQCTGADVVSIAFDRLDAEQTYITNVMLSFLCEDGTFRNGYVGGVCKFFEGLVQTTNETGYGNEEDKWGIDVDYSHPIAPQKVSMPWGKLQCSVPLMDLT